MILTSLKAWPAQASAYHPVIRQALTFLAQNDFKYFAPGKTDLIPGRMFCLLQEMYSVPFEQARPESHRKFIDIQYLISGDERMGVSCAESGKHTVVDDLTSHQDIIFWQVESEETHIVLRPGMFAIFFPEDIHRPCCHLEDGDIKKLRKAVVKIDLQLLEATG